MWYAFIRFQTESGEYIEFRSNAGNKPLYQKGEQVIVLYDPDAPETAQINSFGVIWATPVFAAVIGLGLLGVWARLSITRSRARVRPKKLHN
jgi:hypothetical protein